MKNLSDGSMEIDVNLDVSRLDDHDIAKLDKRLKRGAVIEKQIEGVQPDENGVAKLKRRLQKEAFERKNSPRDIDTDKVEPEEWRDVFEMPDYLRHPNSQEKKGGTIDFPFLPSEYFRHARISLRNKLKNSKYDRKAILDEFFATAVSDNMIVLQAMRLHLDKLCIQPPDNRFQDAFIVNYGTINSVKERKEKHVMALFESMSRIENIPISIGQVGQLNVAGANQQVNNDLHKSPATEIEAEDAS